MAAPDPETLRLLRENSGLRLDRDGRFWHEGGLVEHPRVAALFHRGLGRADDGRPTLTVGHMWAYVAVDDVLYRVRRARCEQDGERLATCTLLLDDGSDEPLAFGADTIALDEEGVLYVRVKNGREWARCLPEAQARLGLFADERPGGMVLATTRGDVSIGRR